MVRGYIGMAMAWRGRLFLLSGAGAGTGVGDGGNEENIISHDMT
jgi:hypothetical protein